MNIDGLTPADIATLIADHLPDFGDAPGRRIVAVAGPPASGKTTVAEDLVAELARRGHAAGLLTMDGFHLDNAILDDKGLRPRKGAPETFDLAGFASLVARVKAGHHVFVPAFDRALDKSINAAREMDVDVKLVVAEGNYLLLDEEGWRGLHEAWDFSAFLDVAEPVLRQRLEDRWTTFGVAPNDRAAKVEGNDLPNAKRVLERLDREKIDLILSQTGE